MSTVRNLDIQSKTKVVTSKASQIVIGGQVPAGKKRWVCFIAVDSVHAAGAKAVNVHFASVGVSNPTKASIVATGNRKMFIPFRATGVKRGTCQVHGGPPFQIPWKPDPNAPLFSIAGGKWLGVACSNTTATVHVVYFDE